MKLNIDDSTSRRGCSSCLVELLHVQGSCQHFFFFHFFFFISLIADGPHHYHPACDHKGSSHLSPIHALYFFYRDASSALLQLVNQWLNFTYSRSHTFRYERKNTNPTLARIELTTSVLADVQLIDMCYSQGEGPPCLDYRIWYCTP